MPQTLNLRASSLVEPPQNATTIVPSDSTDLPQPTRAIYVGTPGDLRVLTQGGQEVIYKNLSGTKVLRAVRIFTTGTTATDLIAEW